VRINGLGRARCRGCLTHSSDFTLVTASKPAASGETLPPFMTGLGGASPEFNPGMAWELHGRARRRRLARRNRRLSVNFAFRQTCARDDHDTGKHGLD